MAVDESVWPGLFQRDLDYLEQLLPTPHPVLREMEEVSAREGVPSARPATGRLLRLLVSISQARRVLEMGTAIGYSALCMALAMPPDGHILGTDIDPERVKRAYEFHRRAGQQGKLEVTLGPLLETLPGLKAATFDFVFIDAVKTEYVQYLNHALRVTRPGGLIVADNLLYGGEAAETPPRSVDVATIQEFNRVFSSHPRLLSTVLPVGDGVGVARVS